MSDQRLLGSILKRSRYATKDLQAIDGPDRAREDRMIERIQEATITGEAYASTKRQIAAGHDRALLRWEDEGGSSSDMDGTVSTKQGETDGRAR